MNKAKVLPKLALTGVIKNGTVYFPFLGAGVFSVFTYFIFASILHNDLMATLPHSGYAWIMLQIGKYLLGIILLPFLFYANSFLIKRRKKEIGLYSILGLEKKHIGFMMLIESLFLYVTALLLGAVGGLVLAKLLFLLLLRMTGLPVDVTFVFYPAAFLETAVYFFCVYAVNFAANLIQVGKTRPVELLSGSKKGEKEPRFLWLNALAGSALLLWGYYVAVNARVDSMIYTNFFLAVLLVVFGTYLLFTSGSIAILKLLKRNGGFYYRPANFITVSGMLYRMKKNAASLANICIFSTMIMITLVCTASLFLGIDEILAFDSPYDAEAAFDGQFVDKSEISQEITALAAEHDVHLEDMIIYDSIRLPFGLEGNKLKEKFSPKRAQDNYRVSFLTLEDYNLMEAPAGSLTEHEIFLYSTGPDLDMDTLQAGNITLQVRQELAHIYAFPKSDKNTHDMEIFVIVSDTAVRDSLAMEWASMNLERNEGLKRHVKFSVSGEKENRYSMIKDFSVWAGAQDNPSFVTNNLDGRDALFALHGGLLFIGVLFSLIFFMCLILIMYYKQISEGYEDRDGFVIMQKVGMSDREIKSTIGRQILLVFFLPLLGAILHSIAGLFMVEQLFATLRMFNGILIVRCTIVVIIVFLVLYAASYSVTARTYYRIVRQS